MNIKTLGALEACVNYTALSVTESSTRKRMDAKAMASSSFTNLIEAIDSEIQEEVDKRIGQNK